MAALVFAACASDDVSIGKSDSIGEESSTGSLVVSVAGEERELRRWDPLFSVKQDSGDRDTLEIRISAESGEDTLGVFVSMPEYLERKALSLVGEYPIRSATLRWDGEESRDVESGELVIETHAMGRVTGSIDLEMRNGPEVSARFDGEIGGTCFVLSGGDAEAQDRDGVEITHDFCAQYFR